MASQGMYSGGFRSGGKIFGRQVKGDQEGDEDEVNPEEEADIHLKPVVSHPERYKVKRGKEEEDVVCKLLHAYEELSMCTELVMWCRLDHIAVR